MSRDQNYYFNEGELATFNQVTLLPESLFSIKDEPASLRDKVLLEKTSDSFTKATILKIELSGKPKVNGLTIKDGDL